MELEVAYASEYWYGASHGTAFMFNGEDHDSFLTFMETRMAERAKEYTRGFFDGLLGKYQRKYRYMTGKYTETKPWKIAEDRKWLLKL